MVIKLGQKVRDKVSGFEGIATSKVEYLNGCLQYGVKPRIGPDGKMTEAEYIDFQQLEIVDDGVSVESSDTGGPQKDRPKR